MIDLYKPCGTTVADMPSLGKADVFIIVNLSHSYNLWR